MLVIFCFNSVGYYFVYLVVKYESALAIRQDLDEEDYDQSEVFYFKTPLSLPYKTDENNFSRVDGSFEHNGQFFKLVKQKWAHDTLHVVCLRDHNEKRLVSAVSNFAVSSNDWSSPFQKTLKLLVSLAKDYASPQLLAHFVLDPIIKEPFFDGPVFHLLPGEQPVISPPPDLSA